MAISITPSPFGSVTVTLDGELGGVLSVSVLATSNSALNMDLGVPGPAGAMGATGAAGTNGTNGVGVPVGGTAGQVLAKINSTNYNTEWVNAGAAGDFLPLSGGTMSGTIFLPSLRNLLNTDLTVTAYNDTGAGTNYVHTFNANDGTFALATNGGGLKFPDATVQLTAGLPLTGGTMSANASVNFTSNVYPETPFLSFIVNDGSGYADFGGSIRGDGFNFYDNLGDTRSITAGYYAGFTHTNGYTGLSTTLNFEGITYPDSSVQTTAGLPLTGGTMTGSVSFGGDVEIAGTNLNVYSTNTLFAVPINVIVNGNSIIIGSGVNGDGITFNDSSVQVTAFPGYAGTTSQYIDGTGSLVTFPTIPSIAGLLIASNNLSDVSNSTTARTNLGLGSMATATATDYLAKAGNLSGLASSSTARTNLGLGTMSTEPASAYLSTASAVANYLTISSAASTYQTQSGMSAYLSTASAVANYQTISGMSAYLSTASAVANYLTISSASSTYQTQSGMSAYLSTASASANFIGTSAYATTAQAQAGTSTTTVVSPSTLLDAKYFGGGKFLTAITWSTATSGAGGSSGANGMNARVATAPTTVAGYAQNSGAVVNNTRGGLYNSGIDWSKRVVFGGRINRNTTTPDTNTAFRFSLGRFSGQAPSDILSTDKQVGIKVSGSGAIVLYAANGSALSTVTSSFTPTNGSAYDVVITSDGAGNVTLFVNGSSVATSTGGPTSSQGTNYGTISFETQNSSTLTNGNMVVFLTDAFVQVNV